MEFLVTMTTHVPEGTVDQAVADVRSREAAHSRELASEGYLRRLWRPPLGPGEWRTLGLFAAVDADRLQEVLASMPLRIWRTDEVTPLAPHPNDPGTAGHGWAPDASSERPSDAGADPTARAPEFLTTFVVNVPEDAPARTIDYTEGREADRAAELARAGYLERLWALPGRSRVLGLWRAGDGDAMEAIIESLPMYGWMTVETTALAPHPSDPELTGTR